MKQALTDDGVGIEYEVRGSGPLTLFFSLAGQCGWF